MGALLVSTNGRPDRASPYSAVNLNANRRNPRSIQLHYRSIGTHYLPSPQHQNQATGPLWQGHGTKALLPRGLLTLKIYHTSAVSEKPLPEYSNYCLAKISPTPETWDTPEDSPLAPRGPTDYYILHVLSL